ncbi:helix-turn-helix domain-containing protein [Geosporobacter ferrireducens]|uniref:AraC family transcriptional regulator n=1 Tax=Geosporobacter ferrireducens TaxID=1424294 RepID=A0A1D8GM73_9FIRM|nr:AraC family transcriptional regulator [Geosporobacter ferrireducens]AOT72018.1 AraC family transcriptional regulator [Geosporobacter ferrireducens]MTI55892.1 helix-turn-helix transcriptional regulator [Geosporobacter ferrireducens]
MKGTLEEKVFYGNKITVIRRDEDCTVYKMKDVTGEGTMTCYNVFPGIDLLYNDFHMQSCFSEFRPKVDMIGIDYCREGRIEWELKNGTYMYLKEGDLQIDTKEHHTNGFGFPLRHYHGITVAVYIEEALNTLSTILDGFSIDLHGIREKFCTGKSPFIMRAEDSIQYIFSELYTVPRKIRKNYFKIKVLEMLLFLSAADVPINGEAWSYFPKKQVEAVKAVMEYITENIDRHITLNELSSRFDIPLTSLKLCFKGVYGTSIYAYMRSYRMHAAASMLRKTNENIITVAGKVGYNNPSKFAAAFKKIMGMPPAKYQKYSV